MGSAVGAAVAVAESFGVRCADPVVLHDGSNVLVHLRPAPVVARVAARTAVIRPGVAAWLARDIAVTGYLAGRGVPVVAPCVDPPAGPHHHDGHALTFFEYVPHDPGYVCTPGEVGRLLGELHVALRDYPGELPADGPIADLRAGLGLVEGLVEGAELARMRAEVERLAGLVGSLPSQALHGDAHPGNLLATPNGLVWNDFEDTWRGPLGWDLACLANTRRLDGWAGVAAYPAPPPRAEIEVCVELRTLYGTWWRLIMELPAGRRTDAGRGRGR
jgi:hypothetical protein